MKRFLALLLVLIMVFSLSACVGSDRPLAPKESKLTTDNTPHKPVITQIDHHVISEETLSYMPSYAIPVYNEMIDAVLNDQAEYIELTDSYDANLIVLHAMRGSPYYFLAKSIEFTEDHTAIKLSYAYSDEEQADIVNYIDSEYLNLINEVITPDMSELEQVLALYHYFGTRISYNYDWLNNYIDAEDKFMYPEIELYEALKTNSGVCHSYTYLMLFALQQLEIECIGLTGDFSDSDESHMWPAIKIDGHYYHCDITFDASDADDTVALTHFGMTDSERDESNITGYMISVDEEYGPIVCDDTRFAEWRNYYDYKLLGNGKMKVWENEGEKSRIIDLTKYMGY